MFVTRAPNILVPLEFIDPTEEKKFCERTHTQPHTHTSERNQTKRKEGNRRENNTLTEWISLYTGDDTVMTMYWNSNIFFLLQRNQSAWNPTVKKKKRKETTIYFKNSNSECNNVNTKRKGKKIRTQLCHQTLSLKKRKLPKSSTEALFEVVTEVR